MMPVAAMMALQAQAGMACVAITAATAQAVMAHAARVPLTVNAQFNAPFARDFSQDIDPVTTWMMPFAFGLFPASPRAAALVTEVRCLQALAARGMAACDAGTVQGADAALPMSSGDRAAMRRSLDALASLIGPPRA
ncbi:MAG: hypothetical protein AAFR52_19350 [Pseudomonadota bacterium]